MENASKALLMAAGVLVGILIITLMITLFVNARNVSAKYENKKTEEKIQQFNINFIKYLNQDLTIHQVVTLTNFAKENNVIVNNEKGIEDINITDIYILKIVTYSDSGYIEEIMFKIKP